MKAIPKPPSMVTELPIPRELDEIIMKCLEKKPEMRFQSAAELEAALRAISFEELWTQSRAREWWDLHGLAVETRPPAAASEEESLSNRGISQFIFEPDS
jgi:serine/threonine protein kinase